MASNACQRSSPSRIRLRLYLLLAVLSLCLIAKTNAQQNMTVDDTNLFITYSPAKSWHASTVPCDDCLMPSNQTAFDGTWHDGTHIVSTIDEDDEGDGGDGGATSSSASTSSNVSSTSAAAASTTKAPISSASSAQPPQSTGDTDTNGGDGDSDNGDNGKGKGGDGKKRLRLRRLLPFQLTERDLNPFETTGDDADDANFTDTPVTASYNFNGTAIYLFSIIPLFPAPANTTPTFTNLTFALDGLPHGQFTHLPDATQPGTPTVNSSITDKFLPNVTVFSASGLNDTNHTLVVNVGDDSVFLFDYAIITQGKSDAGPLSDDTGTDDTVNDTTHQHDVATFAGAVGGSVGFLSVLALGLCISIRVRRRRASLRERRQNNAFAEVFTAQDHGNLEEAPQPTMSQARPFVPRYFPGSVPASPPPYVVDPSVPAYTTNPLGISINRAGLPVTNPSAPPFGIPLPIPSRGLNSAPSVTSSYADRAPPTPSSEEAEIVFGLDPAEQSQNIRGGIVGPLPTDSPAAEESDPMLSLDMSSNREMQWSSGGDSSSRTMSERRRSSTSLHSLSSDAHATPSLTRDSMTGSSVSREEPSTPKRTSHLPPGLYPTLNTSASFPSLYHPRPQRLSSPSQPNLFSSPRSTGGSDQICVTYPILQPSRIPLPASIYEVDAGSEEAIARHDSRT